MNLEGTQWWRCKWDAKPKNHIVGSLVRHWIELCGKSKSFSPSPAQWDNMLSLHLWVLGLLLDNEKWGWGSRQVVCSLPQYRGMDALTPHIAREPPIWKYIFIGSEAHPVYGPSLQRRVPEVSLSCGDSMWPSHTHNAWQVHLKIFCVLCGQCLQLS